MRRYAPGVVVFIVTGLAVLLMVPVAWYLFLSVFAWRVPSAASVGARDRTVFVLIPAHDEEAVIGSLLADLAAQRYATDRLHTHVVADRCTDGTAAVARRYAEVHERREGESSKGAALGWLVARLDIPDDAIVLVFDADNRVPRDMVGQVVDAADAGAVSVQCYLEPANPDASSIALAGAMSQWLANRLIDLPKRNLGLSSSIMGTGYALRGDVTKRTIEGTAGMTEDQQLNDQLVVAGISTIWLHRTHVRDEKPTSLAVLTQQRARWFEGKRRRRSTALGALVSGAGRWSLSRVERILQLLLPGRIVSFAGLALIAAVAAVWPQLLAFSPLWILGLLVAAIGVSVAALAVEGAGPARIAKLPLLAVYALIWIPERLIARRRQDWYHTPHEGTPDG